MNKSIINSYIKKKVTVSTRRRAQILLPTLCALMLVSGCGPQATIDKNSDFLTPLNDPSTRSIVALPKQIPHDWRVFSVENGTNDLRDGKVPGYKITFSGGETGNMIRLCIHTPGNEDFCSVSGQVYKHASHEDCVSGKLTGKECSGYTEPRVIDVEHPTPDATVMISYKTPPAEAINLFENQPLLFHWERFEWVNRDAFIAR